MSTDAPGSQQLLLGLTRYFSGAVVLTCREYTSILRQLNDAQGLTEPEQTQLPSLLSPETTAHRLNVVNTLV